MAEMNEQNFSSNYNPIIIDPGLAQTNGQTSWSNWFNINKNCQQFAVMEVKALKIIFEAMYRWQLIYML